MHHYADMHYADSDNRFCGRGAGAIGTGAQVQIQVGMGHLCARLLGLCGAQLPFGVAGAGHYEYRSRWHCCVERSYLEEV